MNPSQRTDHAEPAVAVSYIRVSTKEQASAMVIRRATRFRRSAKLTAARPQPSVPWW